MPDNGETLAAIASDMETCRRCPLYRDTTGAVAGEGQADAVVMLVGEQPGDQEDRAGRPFVGPAGKILDEAIEAAGLERARLFLTNAVKHFKHENRGKRRIHMRPNISEIRQCRWWLDKELAAVRPRLVVALGVTAGQALTGRTLVLRRERGRALELPEGRTGLVTNHPSAILRIPDKADRSLAFDALVADLKLANTLARGDS
jgi:DNA polymerase